MFDRDIERAERRLEEALKLPDEDENKKLIIAHWQDELFCLMVASIPPIFEK